MSGAHATTHHGGPARMRAPSSAQRHCQVIAAVGLWMAWQRRELAPAASPESLEALQQGGAAGRTRLARSCQQEAWHEQEQFPCPLCSDAAAGFGECNPLSACTNARRTPAARKRGTSRIVGSGAANTSRSTTASSDSQDDRVALACAPGAKAVAAVRVSSRAAESLEASSGAAAAVGLRRPRRPLPRARRPAPSAAGAVGESAGHMGILGRLSVRHRRHLPQQRSVLLCDGGGEYQVHVAVGQTARLGSEVVGQRASGGGNGRSPVSLQKSRLDCSRHVPIWRFRDVKGCGNRDGVFGERAQGGSKRSVWRRHARRRARLLCITLRNAVKQAARLHDPLLGAWEPRRQGGVAVSGSRRAMRAALRIAHTQRLWDRPSRGHGRPARRARASFAPERDGPWLGAVPNP